VRIKGKLLRILFPVNGKMSVGATMSKSACSQPTSCLMRARDPVVRCPEYGNRTAQQETSSRGVVTEWKQETLRIHWMVDTENANTILGGESSVKHPLVREEEKDGGRAYNGMNLKETGCLDFDCVYV